MGIIVCYIDFVYFIMYRNEWIVWISGCYCNKVRWYYG